MFIAIIEKNFDIWNFNIVETEYNEIKGTA